MASHWVWLVVAGGGVALVAVLRWAIADFWLDRIGGALIDWRPGDLEGERPAGAPRTPSI